jgi:2'-5' RNA ligase superfamily
MRSQNAQHYADLLAQAGIDPDRMGCVMADFDPIPVTSLLPRSITFATDPNRPWVRAKVAESGSHVTLLYGLLDPQAAASPDPLNHRAAGQHLTSTIYYLLFDLMPLDPVTVTGAAFFPSPGVSYGAVVLLIDSPQFREANRRLRFLPHIDTFAEYRPHLTLAYVANEDGDRAASAALSKLAGHQLRPRPTLGLGGEIG